MPEGDSFDRLMAGLRAGDPDAAREVFQRFAGRLIALARAELGARLRQKVDPEDVLQSAYKSFFVRQARGLLDPPDWDGLWAALTVITVRKCRRVARRYGADKRDLNRAPQAPSDDPGDWQALARDPTPSEAVVLAETVEGLLRGLGVRDRAIVGVALQGCTPAEISTQLRRSQRTVYRVLEQVKKKLRQTEETDAGGAGAC